MRKFTAILKDQEAKSTGHISIRHGFVVRIELHGIKDSNDYKHLYEELDRHEFTEFITSALNERFELPRATYYHSDPKPNKRTAASDVHRKAETAVKIAIEKEPLKTLLENKDATIVVIKTESVYWTGLKPYEPESIA